MEKKSPRFFGVILCRQWNPSSLLYVFENNDESNTSQNGNILDNRTWNPKWMPFLSKRCHQSNLQQTITWRAMEKSSFPQGKHLYSTIHLQILVHFLSSYIFPKRFPMIPETSKHLNSWLFSPFDLLEKVLMERSLHLCYTWIRPFRRHDDTPRVLGPPKFGMLFFGKGKFPLYFQRGSLGVGEEIIYFIWPDGGWIFVETNWITTR